MDLTKPTALDYIPPGVGRKELYKFLGPLIDYALTPAPLLRSATIDPLVAPLLLQYEDAEAVNAYLNAMVHPIIGTRRAMDVAFGLLNIQPKLVEWWQPRLQGPYDPKAPTGYSDRPFHFTVTFPNGTLPTGPFSYLDLIQMILALKNERSRLISVRMADCVGNLTLDNECTLDMYWLDDLEGFVDPITGVNICLHDHLVQNVNLEERVPGALATWNWTQVTHAFNEGLLDFTILDMDTDTDAGTIRVDSGRVTDHVAHPTYTLVNMDPKTGIYQVPIGRTTGSTVVGGGPDVNVSSRQARTCDRVQRSAPVVAPSIRQTISARSTTVQVPSTSFYRQRSWSDTPDGLGTGRTWSVRPLTWLSDQPQAFQQHSQQIVAGWTLGSAAASMPRLGVTASGFYGSMAKVTAVLGRPTAAAQGKAPPAGSGVLVDARPFAAAVGSVGVGINGTARMARPGAAGSGRMVPVGNGLASMPTPFITGKGIAASM